MLQTIEENQFQHITPQNNDTFNNDTQIVTSGYLCVLLLDVEGLWLLRQVVWLLASLREEWGDQRWDWKILWWEWHHDPGGFQLLMSRMFLVIVQWLQLCTANKWKMKFEVSLLADNSVWELWPRSLKKRHYLCLLVRKGVWSKREFVCQKGYMYLEEWSHQWWKRGLGSERQKVQSSYVEGVLFKVCFNFTHYSGTPLNRHPSTADITILKSRLCFHSLHCHSKQTGWSSFGPTAFSAG